MSDNSLETIGRLLAAIFNNAPDWLRYWSDITLHPKAYAKRFNFSTNSALTMFVINNAIGFLLFLLIFCAYWAIFFTKAFRGHWLDVMKNALFIFAGPLFLAVLSLLLTIIPGLITFPILHATRGRGTLAGYISRTLVCTNLEWLVSIFFAIGFLVKDLPPRMGWEEHLVIYSSICILLIRLYYAFLQTTLISPYCYKVDFSPFVAFLTIISSVVTGLSYTIMYFIFLAIAVHLFD
jgi:hypothetical protein